MIEAERNQRWRQNAIVEGGVPASEPTALLDSVDVDFLIAIQVHNRSEYLRALLETLAQVRGIERALLVFSQDVVESATPNLNELIASVNFTRASIFFCLLNFFHRLSRHKRPITATILLRFIYGIVITVISYRHVAPLKNCVILVSSDTHCCCLGCHKVSDSATVVTVIQFP